MFHCISFLALIKPNFHQCRSLMNLTNECIFEWIYIMHFQESKKIHNLKNSYLVPILVNIVLLTECLNANEMFLDINIQ